jgi:hypothetical protein
MLHFRVGPKVATWLEDSLAGPGDDVGFDEVRRTLNTTQVYLRPSRTNSLVGVGGCTQCGATLSPPLF